MAAEKQYFSLQERLMRSFYWQPCHGSCNVSPFDTSSRLRSCEIAKTKRKILCILGWSCGELTFSACQPCRSNNNSCFRTILWPLLISRDLTNWIKRRRQQLHEREQMVRSLYWQTCICNYIRVYVLAMQFRWFWYSDTTESLRNLQVHVNFVTRAPSNLLGHVKSVLKFLACQPRSGRNKPCFWTILWPLLLRRNLRNSCNAAGSGCFGTLLMTKYVNRLSG